MHQLLLQKDIVFSFCQFVSLKDICNLHLTCKNFSKVKLHVTAQTLRIDFLDNKYIKSFPNAQYSFNCHPFQKIHPNIFNRLKTTKFINSIIMYACKLTDKEVGYLSKILLINANIHSLVISHNKIGQGAIAIANSLKVNNTLTDLDMSSCQIGNAGAIVFANTLKENTTLQYLNIHDNEIDYRGILAIADSLKVNTTLKILNISKNENIKEGVIAIADALKVNTSLTDLNINNTRISDTEISAICEALKVNTTLIFLDIGDNWSMNSNTEIPVAEMLKVNTTLKSLCFNNFASVGITRIADALKHNNTLTSLYVRQNGVCNHGALALADMLKTNTSLIFLNIEDSGIQSKGLIAICESLHCNKTLKKLYMNDNGNYYDNTEFYKLAAKIKEERKDIFLIIKKIEKYCIIKYTKYTTHYYFKHAFSYNQPNCYT